MMPNRSNVGVRMFIAIAGMVVMVISGLALVDVLFYTEILSFSTWGQIRGAMSIPSAV